MNVGAKIRAVRKDQHLSQIDLAKKAGIAVNSLRLYEAGKRNPSLKNLIRIADALEVQLSDLLNAPNGMETTLGELFPNIDWAAIEESRNKQQARVTMNHMKEALGNSEHIRQMSFAEQYRAGFLKFNSDEDRTAFFYSHLNDSGKIAAGGYFFRHIKTEDMTNVADYVLSLYENPLYKAQDAPTTPSEGTDTTSPKCPSEGTGEGTENK